MLALQCNRGPGEDGGKNKVEQKDFKKIEEEEWCQVTGKHIFSMEQLHLE